MARMKDDSSSTQLQDGLGTLIQRGAAARQPDVTHINGLAVVVAIVIVVLGILGARSVERTASPLVYIFYWTAVVLLAMFFLNAIKIARQWEKAVVLRMGKFNGLRGPGFFWLIPIIESTPAWIDHRVMVSSFNAEKTLTKDTVPVDVDAVLFWLVWDAEKAALEVQDYRATITWASQTALREIIGQMDLADILVGRDKMDADLQKI
ncbi:MAG TPA: SPFH domain-containing protein, partial [Anaerolineaceae bacterium]